MIAWLNAHPLIGAPIVIAYGIFVGTFLYKLLDVFDRFWDSVFKAVVNKKGGRN